MLWAAMVVVVKRIATDALVAELQMKSREQMDGEEHEAPKRERVGQMQISWLLEVIYGCHADLVSVAMMDGNVLVVLVVVVAVVEVAEVRRW